MNDDMTIVNHYSGHILYPSLDVFCADFLTAQLHMIFAPEVLIFNLAQFLICDQKVTHVRTGSRGLKRPDGPHGLYLYGTF